ncbi:MAG: sulfatase-like hydrolase/transferase [Deltaproteobacteria bacterium]|nr:sulfatase-like hydrolase/transferase [Deltaproteobacteria bacterium]
MTHSDSYSSLLKSNHLFLNIFVIIFLALLAPALKLLTFNSDYFSISALEAFIAVLSISLIFVLPLLVLTLFKPLRQPLLLFVIFILIASVTTTFLLPVSLGVIDGIDTASLEIRKESQLFVFFTLLVFLFFLALFAFSSRFGGKALRLIHVLKLISITYVVFFAVFTAFSIPVLFPKTTSKGHAFAPVSPEKNIFVISFDQIQGSFMEGYIKKCPEKQSIFDGFVFYPDAAATYPNTQYSISSTLLGRIAKNASESGHYAFKSLDSILATAEVRGFKIYANSSFKSSTSECVTCFDEHSGFNIIKSYELIRHSVNLAFGIDISACGLTLPQRLAGHVDPRLKDHLWQIDLYELQQVIDNLTKNSQKPALYFMHFLGTHQPFIYNHKCTLKTPEEISRSQNIRGAKDNIACLISLVNAFITRLKELSIYDNSMIFIISDHGYESNINKLYYEENGLQFFTETSMALGDSKNIKPAGAYNPILFFKDFQSRGDLLINHSPASLIDIAPTICEAIQCDRYWEGFSLRDEIPSNRKREFWQYFGGAGKQRSEANGTDKLHEGLDVWWKINSFRGPLHPNLAFALGLTEEQYSRQYTLGESIGFGANGTSNIYTTYGWSGQEERARWTEGPKAGIKINALGSEGKDLLLRLNALAYLGNNLKYQEVGVIVNGTQIKRSKLTGLDWYEAFIPADVSSGGSLEIVFTISDPTAPCEVSDSKDCRKLGMAVREVIVSESKPAFAPAGIE